MTKAKTRLSILEEENRFTADLRRTLEGVTQEYEAYREDREHRIQRLITELKEKDSRCENLSREMSLRLDNS